MKRIAYSVTALAIAALAAISCKDGIENPFGGLVIHGETGIRSAAVAFADGRIRSDGTYSVKPVGTVGTEGECEFPLYITWSLDGGEPVTQGPFNAGDEVKYDLADQPLAPGRHTVEGDVWFNDALGQRQVVKPFADSFEIIMDYVPDFEFSVVREGVETPIFSYIPCALEAGTAYTLQAKAGSKKVLFKTLDYGVTFMDFILVSRVEQEGCSYVPFTTKAAGTTVLEARIEIDGVVYTPQFTFIINER